MPGVVFLAAAFVVVLGLAAAVVVRGSAAAARTSRRLAVLVAASLALVVPGVAFAAVPYAAPHADTAPTAPVEHTTTVRYGPLLLPANLGLDSGHAGQTATYAGPTIEMPCKNCYVTGIQPDMVYADGSQANYQTGAMLHHMVLFDPSKSDPTCGRQGVGLVSGQRIFAAGNERTGARLPDGYGYRLGATPLGTMAELMNMSAQPQQVFITVKVTWVDAATATLKDVTPVWLDVNNCGNSQYTVPEGPSHTMWTWKSTMDGDVVAVGGHVHDHGISITLSNATRHQEICKSVAGYGSGMDDGMSGGMPGGMPDGSHVVSMSTCSGDPLATVRKGDALTLDSYYESPMRDDSVMGIMIAYVHQTR